MFLKKDRERGVKNTVTEGSTSSMRVVLDGAGWREVSFALKDYAALDYGYAATAQNVQGATIDQTSCWARPAWIATWPMSV
jgi:ATP-dependent exoDNAse (exonuclease V) alpha subunit